jgi:hypothetical protein
MRSITRVHEMIGEPRCALSSRFYVASFERLVHTLVDEDAAGCAQLVVKRLAEQNVHKSKAYAPRLGHIGNHSGAPRFLQRDQHLLLVGDGCHEFELELATDNGRN